MFKTCRRPAVVAAVLLVPIGLAACGESSEEKATAQVCSSTKEIQAQLSKLSSLSISSKAPEEIKDAASVMEKEAAKIKESTANLPAASKAPVESAQTALKAELAALAKAAGLDSKILGERRSRAQAIRASGQDRGRRTCRELQAGIRIPQMLLAWSGGASRGGPVPEGHRSRETRWTLGCCSSDDSPAESGRRGLGGQERRKAMIVRARWTREWVRPTGGPSEHSKP